MNSGDVRESLSLAGLDPDEVYDLVRRALDEDLGIDRQDLTSAATISPQRQGVADLVARADGVVAGLPVAAAVFEVASGGALRWNAVAADGAEVSRGDVLATVSGTIPTLLTAERTALNFLCHLSGIATHTSAWVAQLAGTSTRVLDTRKTTPGLRHLEKYAVRAGGGVNKRMGLYDVAMIKDNHTLAAGSITAAYALVRERFPDVEVQVEVESLAEALEAVEIGAGYLLCDNMSPELLRDVVDVVAGRAELEATGGLTLAVAARYAATGVNYLSVGALTHSSPILDIGLDLRAR